MSERTPVPADTAFRCAIQMICTAETMRREARCREQRTRRSLEALAAMHSRDAMTLVLRGAT